MQRQGLQELKTNIMKEIIIRREKWYFNQLDFTVVLEGGRTVQIGNGESKKVQFENTPVQVHAEFGWLKSRKVLVDSATTELVITSEKVKPWIAPLAGVLLGFSLSRLIWPGSSFTTGLSMSITGVILLWIVYAFVIKRSDWVRIERRV